MDSGRLSEKWKIPRMWNRKEMKVYKSCGFYPIGEKLSVIWIVEDYWRSGKSNVCGIKKK